MSFPGKHPPPPTPTATSEVNLEVGPKSETAPEPKIESRRVTLECQTLKVREPVRRSFVTDLAKFRHLFIRQPGGSSLGLPVVNLRTI